MTIEQWLAKHNITNELDVLKYKAWYKYQAEKRHIQKLEVINPEQIVLTKNTTMKMKFDMAVENLPKAIELFNLDIRGQIINNADSKIPNYLLTNDEIELGYHMVRTSQKSKDIDYSLFNHDVSKFDFYTKGEFMIHLPKNTHQMSKGASMMVNCVEIHADSLIDDLNKDPNNFVNQYRYLDAHVLKDNVLIGVLALEEINHIIKTGSPRMNLFVNFSNSSNSEMEKFCFNLVEEVLNIKLPKYELDRKYSKDLVNTKSGSNSRGLANIIKW